MHLGYRHALVDDVVGRLVELGYLDDGTFARAWVESRDRSRPRGESALRRELALKGVDRAVIDEVLTERAAGSPDAGAEGGASFGDGATTAVAPDRTVSADVDREAAERLLHRKAASLRREPDERKRRQKAYALLARNGFDPETCRTISATVTTAGDSPGDE